MDSLQKMMIEKIKYQVKKDLKYLTINTKAGKNMGLPTKYGYKYMMIDPMGKYGHSFETHVNMWLEAHTQTTNNMFINTEYGLHPDSLYPDDIPVIEQSIKKWTQKMIKECYFV